MPSIRVRLSCVIFVILLFATAAFAQEGDDVDSMQCAGGIVFVGDNKYKVWEKCGKPTVREENGNIWIYNFGPTDFIYYLTFTNDLLERLQMDGYGH